MDTNEGEPRGGRGRLGQAYWAAMPVKLKEACAQSPAYWYTNNRNFPKAGDGNHYFLDHWYHRWFKMSPKAKQIIDLTQDDYTAMSEKEFFANAYAEYFEDPRGKRTRRSGAASSPRR